MGSGPSTGEVILAILALLIITVLVSASVVMMVLAGVWASDGPLTALQWWAVGGLTTIILQQATKVTRKAMDV